MKNHILSAGVVIVRGLPAPRYLLLRAYQYWDFPKGIVEPGEDPFEAAQREVREETDLTHLNFRWGMAFRETGPYAHGKIARYYVAESVEGEVALLVNPALGRPEHDEYRWVTYQGAMELVGSRLRPILGWANRVIKTGLPASEFAQRSTP